MAEVTNEELIKAALSVLNPRKIRHGFTVGDVGCALVTDKGNIYRGVSIDTCSGMGFCAEHSAIASMITNGESRIVKIVAVFSDSVVGPPCGRCREFMHQVHPDNLEADIIMTGNKVVKLRDLLPYPWDEDF